MSYLTAMKLQYGETQAQESARLTSTFSCRLVSSIAQTAHGALPSAAAQSAASLRRIPLVLTPGRPRNKIVSTCRPERRHISFRHDFGIWMSGRDLASSVADLRAGRPRFRARRGRLADRDQRRPLSRFHLRRRRQRARPCASARWSRRSPSRPRRSDPRLQPLSAFPKASGWPTGSARRASPTTVFFANSGAEAMEGASSWRASTSPPTASPSATASSPSKARSTAARWRRSRPAATRNISTASARWSRASTRCRSATSRRSSARSRPRPPAS